MHNPRNETIAQVGSIRVPSPWDSYWAQPTPDRRGSGQGLMQEVLGARGYFIFTEVAKGRQWKREVAGHHLRPDPRGVCPRVKAP